MCKYIINKVMTSFFKNIVNFWTGYSENRAKIFERKILYKWSGVPPEEISINDVPISSDEDDTMHCISIANGKKQPFVLIPAYGSSGALYYKLMKFLSDKYDLYLVDMRGMGR